MGAQHSIITPSEKQCHSPPNWPPVPRGGLQGWTGTSGTPSRICDLHPQNFGHQPIDIIQLKAAIENNDLAFVTKYAKEHSTLPCFLIDVAKDMKTVVFLKNLGACCVYPHRSELAKNLLGVKQALSHYYPCESIEDAILCDHRVWLAVLVLEKKQKSTLQAEVWHDWVVQQCMVDLLRPHLLKEYKNHMPLCLLPEIVVEIYTYLDSWDHVCEELRAQEKK